MSGRPSTWLGWRRCTEAPRPGEERLRDDDHGSGGVLNEAG
jgi:hypothetical protein